MRLILRHFTAHTWRWTWIGLLIVAAMALLQTSGWRQIQSGQPTSRLDHLVYDIRFNLLPPKRTATPNLVIVDLDEASIQQEGRWPWPRAKMAKLIKQLKAQGSALIGLDIIFSEVERNPAEQVLAKAQLSKELRQQLRKQAIDVDGDQVLAQAINFEAVLGFFLHNGRHNSGQLPFAFQQLDTTKSHHNALQKFKSYTANVPVLANFAAAQGFTTTVPDADGIVRRVPLVAQYQGDLYASLSLEMARLALGAQWLKLDMVDNGHQQVATQIHIGDKASIPVSADASVLVPYRGPARSFPTISATKILQNQLTTDEQLQLDHAIVLIGTSALGLADLRTTPIQTSFPGVEIHANVLNALLQAAQGQQPFYQQPDWSPAFSLLLLLLVGLSLAVLLPRLTPAAMLATGLITLLAITGLNGWLWQAKHLALPLALQWLTAILLLGLNVAAGFIHSNRQKRQVEGLFGSYVPPEYVKLMLEQPNKATMDGEQREMTVLFADVVGFTALSENLTTAELKYLLNRYLSQVTRVIFNHHGTIDKYVGDMVMAFWNAPLDDAQHAQNGVLAALAMQEQVEQLRPVLAQQGLPAIAIGTGLNTGMMNVGDMGSDYRRAYTVLGDAVNLGSRLEGLTRFYGVPILVSAQTRQQCPDIVFRPIDCIRVKGKDEPTEIAQPIGHQAAVTSDTLHVIHLFEQALKLYRQREFSQVLQLLHRLLKQDADNATLYQIYIDRCTQFLAKPPPAHWSGIYTHTSK